jgi:hypothetical protein
MPLSDVAGACFISIVDLLQCISTCDGGGALATLRGSTKTLGLYRFLFIYN